MNTNKDQFSSDVKLWNNRFYFTWTSNHVEGTSYDIWANVLDWNDPYTSITDHATGMIVNYQLLQNYLNPTTTIAYALPGTSRVILTIYNTLGLKVHTLVNRYQTAGRYTVQWDGRDEYGRPVPAGVYFYRLKAGQFEQVRKMVLVR